MIAFQSYSYLLYILYFHLHISFRYPTSKRLSSHLNVHNPENHAICDQCGKTFQNKHRLKYHIRFDHFNEMRPKKIPEQCSYCDKWYSSKCSLYEHIKNMHTDTGAEHRCQTCGFVSTTSKALKKHILFNHDVVRKHKCNLCEKAFKRPLDLKVWQDWVFFCFDSGVHRPLHGYWPSFV